MAQIFKIMKKSNYVVWPAPLSKFLKMARGPKSLPTSVLYNYILYILPCVLGNRELIVLV